MKYTQALGVMLLSGQHTLMVSRSTVLAVPKLTGRILGLDLHRELSRAKIHVYSQAGRGTDPWTFDKSASMRICGRQVLNIWRIMRSELDLLSYKMENAVFHLLGRR